MATFTRVVACLANRCSELSAGIEKSTQALKSIVGWEALKEHPNFTAAMLRSSIQELWMLLRMHGLYLSDDGLDATPTEIRVPIDCKKSPPGTPFLSMLVTSRANETTCFSITLDPDRSSRSAARGPAQTVQR